MKISDEYLFLKTNVVLLPHEYMMLSADFDPRLLDACPSEELLDALSRKYTVLPFSFKYALLQKNPHLSVTMADRILHAGRVELQTILQELSRQPSDSFIVAQAKEYMHTHYAKDISIEDIADAVYRSGSYICAVFKKETGSTIVQYLRQYRIAAAQKLFVLALFIIMTIVGLFTYAQVKEQQYAQVRNGYEDSMSTVFDNLDRDVRKVRKTMQFIAVNPVLQKLFLRRYDSVLQANNDVAENLEVTFWYQITSPNSFIDQLDIYSATPLEAYGDFISYDANLQSYDWYREIEKTHEPVLYGRGYQLYYAYPIMEKNTLHLLGAVHVCIDTERLLQELADSSSKKDWGLYFDGQKLGEKKIPFLSVHAPLFCRDQTH